MKAINKLSITALTALAVATAGITVTKNITYADSDSKIAQVERAKSYSDAETIASKEVKKGQISDIDLKIKGNKPVFDITIVDGNDETELRIDANTGKILQTQVEVDLDSENQTLSSAKPKVDFSAIEKAVIKDYPDATIDSIKLKVSQSSVYYKVDLIDGTQEIEATYSADDASKISEEVEIDD